MSAPPKAAAEPTLDPQGGTDLAVELGILFPDEPIGVHDPDTGEIVALKVREFRFEEGLEATATAQPIARGLAALGTEGAEAEDELSRTLAFHAVVAEHHEQWLALIARACGREPDWIARLNHKDGRRMNDVMWSTNGPFLLDLAATALGMNSRAARLFRLVASLMRSSAPATDAATGTSPGA